MGALQGVDDTYYVGGQFSFETTLLSSQVAGGRFCRSRVISFVSGQKEMGFLHRIGEEIGGCRVHVEGFHWRLLPPRERLKGNFQDQWYKQR
jgi:hypothetical protein